MSCCLSRGMTCTNLGDMKFGRPPLLPLKHWGTPGTVSGLLTLFSGVARSVVGEIGKFKVDMNVFVLLLKYNF